MNIAENSKHLREEIPDHVTIVLSVKQRSAQEVVEAIEAGATDIGENYVQEGEHLHSALQKEATEVRWHMIGHLQTNKINKALRIFDVIQTVDSLEKAVLIDKRAERAHRDIVPIYVEINIGSEFSKAGIKPADHEPFDEYIEELARDISTLDHLRLVGLMTTGPRSGNPEDLRPYFRRTKIIFERIKNLDLVNVHLQYLSMGMTNSYGVAIEEGANMVRIGSAVFGRRDCVR